MTEKCYGAGGTASSFLFCFSSLLYSFKNSKMSVASSLLQCVSSGGDFVTHLVMSGDILDCFILGGGAC